MRTPWLEIRTGEFWLASAANLILLVSRTQNLDSIGRKAVGKRWDLISTYPLQGKASSRTEVCENTLMILITEIWLAPAANLNLIASRARSLDSISREAVGKRWYLTSN